MKTATLLKTPVRHHWANPDTILLATILKDAAHLVPHAIAQAKLTGARVLLVHVIEPSYLRTSPAGGLPLVVPAPTVESVQEELKEIAKQFRSEGILCEPIVLKGMPTEQVPPLVTQRAVDRVIIGTRSAGTIERIFLGSVADDLLHELDVPLCVIGPHVRRRVRTGKEPRSILFATSFHHRSQQAAKLASELSCLYQSRLTLLHVMSTRDMNKDEREQARHEKEAELSRLITEEDKLWTSPSIATREGDPVKEILAEAAKVSAELIVLGATGASSASRLLAAGVAYRVIAEARVPVITLREEPDDSC
jgi:nucleotide-binding universal stress UspA family protein